MICPFHRLYFIVHFVIHFVKASYLLVSVNKITWLSKEALDNVHPTAIELKNLLVHDWSVNQSKFKIWIIKNLHAAVLSQLTVVL